MHSAVHASECSALPGRRLVTRALERGTQYTVVSASLCQENFTLSCYFQNTVVSASSCQENFTLSCYFQYTVVSASSCQENFTLSCSRDAVQSTTNTVDVVLFAEHSWQYIIVFQFYVYIVFAVHILIVHRRVVKRADCLYIVCTVMRHIC